MDAPPTRTDSPAAPDPVHDLLLDCLEAPPAERKARLDALRSSDPGHGRRVEQLLALLDDFGFLHEPAETAPGLPERIGDFRILRLLGRGGMGTVYLAEQQALGRRVALKVIHPHLVQSPRARERFRREAMAASRLDHPAICAVYEIGEVDDVPFLAMRLVAGRTLDQHIREAAAERRSCVQLPQQGDEGPLDAILRHVETLAQALHQAHAAGLVHRDVKPGNVVITPDQGPVLLDFGLAVVGDEGRDRLTVSGDHIGTPLYMAPEQVASGTVDARTDIYALGVLLYECLTLAPPFLAVSRESLFQQILHEEPADPRRRNPAIGRDLAVVLQTAMAKEPDRRYRTAAALADDLARVRRREPIAARPAGVWLRLQRFARRHPTAAVALVALMLGLLVVGALLRRVEAEKSRAEYIGKAVELRQVAQTDPRRALAEARAIYLRHPEATTLNTLYAALAGVQEEQRFDDHRMVVWRCVFSPDGRFVATCSDDRTARVWDTKGEEQVRTLQHDADLTKTDNVVDIDAHGDRLLTASRDGRVVLWRFNGTRLAEAPLPAGRQRRELECFRARFSHDGTAVVIASFAGTAWIWNLPDNRLVTLTGQRGQSWACGFSPDDRLVLTASGTNDAYATCDNTVHIWHRDGSPNVDLPHPKPLFDAAFSPDGRQVLTGCRDGVVRLWQLTDGAGADLLRELRGFEGEIRCVRFHPRSSRLIAAGDSTGHVRLFDAQDGSLVTGYDHDGTVLGLEFTPDGDRILTASRDKTAQLRDLSGRLLRVLRGHADWVTSARFSPDGRHIATTSYDTTLRLWQPDDEEFRVFAGDARGGVQALAGAADRRFFAGYADGSVRSLDARHVTPPTRLLPEVRSGVSRLVLGPDRRALVAAFDDHSYVVWRDPAAAGVPMGWPAPAKGPGDRPAWRNNKVVFLDESHFLAVQQLGPAGRFDLQGGHDRFPLPTDLQGAESTAIAMHADALALGYWGGAIAVCDRDCRIRFVEQGLPAPPAHGHRDRIASLQFSSDGRLLLSASADKTAVLRQWDGERLQFVRRFAHDAALTGASFSPDGRTILTTAQDGLAKLWDLSGNEVLTIRTGPRAVLSAAWSLHGDYIATGSEDGLVRVWPVRIEHLSELALDRLRQ